MWAKLARQIDVDDPQIKDEIIEDTDSLSESVVERVVASILKTDLRPDLAKLVQPLLAVYCTNDAIVNNEQADLLRDEYRSLQVLKMRNSNHFPFLDQPNVFRLAHSPPNRHRPNPDQLAKHLADLGSGGEISRFADGRARRIVAMLRVREAQLHVFGHGETSETFQATPQLHLKRHDAGKAQDGTAFRLTAKAIRSAPTSISGKDRSIPIVKPPQRNPSCTSG